MAIDPKTIGGQIDCLARLTGAPDSFVEQVRALFLNKGISLEDEAAPYLTALEEAFVREKAIRRSTGDARRNLARLQQQFNRLGAAYRRQLQQLKEIRSTLESNPRFGIPNKRKKAKTGAGSSRAVVLAVRRPSVVTRPQRDGRPLVPGPKDVQ